MNESKYIQTVHQKIAALKKARAVDKRFDPWKINTRYQGGVFDCCYIGRKVFWVEWKFDPQPTKTIELANEKRKTSLSSLQQLWGEEKHGLGQNVAVIYATMKYGGIVLRYPEWLEPITKDEYLEQAIDKESLVRLIVDEAGMT